MANAPPKSAGLTLKTTSRRTAMLPASVAMIRAGTSVRCALQSRAAGTSRDRPSGPRRIIHTAMKRLTIRKAQPLV